jgi:hypothetical protein
MTIAGGPRMAWLGKLRTVTMLTVAGFAIASSVQTGCAGQTAPAPGDTPPGAAPTTCSQGQTPMQLGAHAVCCSSTNGGALSCAQPDEVDAGMPCAPAGATRPGDGFEVVVDQCVTEACTGDRTSTPYPYETTRLQGTLVCQGHAGSTTWQWQGSPSEHRVVRTCVVTGQTVCSATAYGSGYADYGYGYGYYSGGASVPVREVLVQASVCTDPQGSTSPCDVGDL